MAACTTLALPRQAQRDLIGRGDLERSHRRGERCLPHGVAVVVEDLGHPDGHPSLIVAGLPYAFAGLLDAVDVPAHARCRISARRIRRRAYLYAAACLAS